MTTTASVAQPGCPGVPPVWTVEAVRKLPAITDVETAGAILGIGRSKSYELAKDGEFPVRILRIGRRYLVPTSAILALLGIADRAGNEPGAREATTPSERTRTSRR